MGVCRVESISGDCEGEKGELAMISDNDDSKEPPLRLHDHPEVIKSKPISSPNGRFKTPFIDQALIDNLVGQLKSRRLYLNWDHRELSRHSGVNLPSIVRIETGKIDGLHFDVVLRIIKALNLRIELVI